MAVRQTIELRVGGHTYRVVSGGAPEDARRLAAIVDERITRVVPKGKTMTPEQAMLLAALSLAHDLVELEGAATTMSAELRRSLTHVLSRVDEVLGEAATDEPARVDDAPSAAPPPTARPASAGGGGLRPASDAGSSGNDLFERRRGEVTALDARRAGATTPSGADDDS